MSILLYIEKEGKWLATVNNQCTEGDIAFPIRKWLMQDDKQLLNVYIGTVSADVLGEKDPISLHAEHGLLKTGTTCYETKERAIHELMPKLAENIHLFMHGYNEYAPFIHMFMGFDFNSLFEKDGLHTFTNILNRFYRLKRTHIGYGFTVFTNIDFENLDKTLSEPKSSQIYTYPLEYTQPSN